MHRYDVREQPPVALLAVQVTDPATGLHTSVLGKLDTGAAISVLPTTIVAALGLAATSDLWVSGYDGRPRRLPAYFINLEIAGYTLELLKVTAIPRAEMLLGRDVLHNFVATFDGKNLTFDLIDP
jgi:hypothetical protein